MGALISSGPPLASTGFPFLNYILRLLGYASASRKTLGNLGQFARLIKAVLVIPIAFIIHTMNLRRASTKRRKTMSDAEYEAKVSNKPPSKSELQRVANLPILDASGKSHSFKSLYEGKTKVLIVFIRHFFCGVSFLLIYPEKWQHLRPRRIVKSIFAHWPQSSLPSQSKLYQLLQKSSSLAVDSRISSLCTSKRLIVHIQSTRTQPRNSTNFWA